MNLFEVYPLILEIIENLQFKSAFKVDGGDKPYLVSDLTKFRQMMFKLAEIPFIQKELKTVRGTSIYDHSYDAVFMSTQEESLLKRSTNAIKIKLSLLKDQIEENPYYGKEDFLFVKLPELSSFDDLSKVSNDFKKAIDFPVIDASVGGDVKIVAGDRGSVVLYVALGSLFAVKLVAAVCWAGLVLKKKSAEAKIFEAHAKTLDLKNDSLQNLVDAQKEQLKNILQAEAEAIVAKHYSQNDPEALERLKLSVVTIADLVERGAKIIPMSNDDEIQKSFPDYNAVGLIESSIKQLKEA